MSEQEVTDQVDVERTLLPVLTEDEVRQLTIALITLGEHVSSERDLADELIAKLAERTAPQGTLKRYALWISQWQHGQIRYRLTRRGRRGHADEHVAVFVGPAMRSDEALEFGRTQVHNLHEIPGDELDVHLLGMPNSTRQTRTAAPVNPRRPWWPRLVRRATR